MFGIIRRFRRSAVARSTARKYARLLGPCLRQDYGASEFYKPAQIEAAVKKCKLTVEDIALGYAYFMPESDFVDLGIVGDYALLRQVLDRFVEILPTSQYNPALENNYALQGYNQKASD